MTNATRTRIHFSIAAIIVAAALATPAAAQTSCAGLAPGCFTGSFRGEDAHDILPQDALTVMIHTTATGTGTHLGQFSLIREVTGNLTNFTAAGSAQWVAANRDTIYTTVFGQAELSDVDGGSLKVTEIHIITGGTGRLTGAQGSFTVVLFHKLAPSVVTASSESHDISGTFHGTITLPGGRH